ncbi:MAG TPA: D-alanyl-D-alanine carboxypeptidase/D-alanyl-D-alanine-endopeptidase [Solirubrobacterales bacterium]|nr:D-alanyl-D-alanine carboxypeptidase/D-alanyl-D-alanine-endopeptidase [Solirubrobacterales bacterium]
MRSVARARRGNHLLAHVLIALVAALIAAPAAAHRAGPDLPGHAPVARPGTEAAAKRALSLAQLRDRLADSMRDAGGASGAWVYDLDASSDPVLFTDDAAASRIPASNQKLFTTATFLDQLGPDGNLETRVFVRGNRSGPRGSLVKGDLVLVGDGDPAFGTARFARSNDQPVSRVADLAREVSRSGVRRITGRVLADDSIFDRERRSGPYLSPLSGLSFNNGYSGGGDYARNPELEAAKGLKNALRKRGVKVAGKVGRANLPAATLQRDPLASVASPPVSALIEETNVPSNNFFAEMLLKRVGAFGGKRGTRDRGARRVEEFAKQVAAGVRVSDGSGLSRKNRASPEQVGKLLVAMAERKRDAAPFRDSLPVAGREGTLADRMRGTAAEGECAAKTGTLNGVSALSGYCEAGAHTVAFSLLMNSVNVDAARDAQDEIAAAIARYQP